MDTATTTTTKRLSVISSHIAPAIAAGCDCNLSSVGVASSADGSLKLKGQVAIVTGSGQGIGEHAAKLFAHEGAKVVVTDLDAAKSDRVAGEIKAAGGTAISVPGDVTDPKFPDMIVQKTIDTFGKIHIIVNNAGYTWDGILHKMTDKQWDAMLLVHNTAPFRLVRAAAPHMRDRAKEEIEKTGQAEPRCIINISSTSGLHGNVGQANYATAKAGVIGFTKTIAKEWGLFGIRCNAVAFGMIETRLTAAKEAGAFIEVDGKKVALGVPEDQKKGRDILIPLRRAGKPEEAGAAIVMLASPLSSYITGHCLEVTGGAGI